MPGWPQRLAGDHDDRIARSGLLPDLDLALIARLAAYPDPQDALALRRLLGRHGRPEAGRAPPALRP